MIVQVIAAGSGFDEARLHPAAAGVAPGMASTIRHVRVAFASEPPGSEIYVNDDRLEYRTNIRLGVTSMADIEDEKRFPIRSPGLVNCYGTIPLPKDAAGVACVHRGVR